jgi:hypothetical protein
MDLIYDNDDRRPLALLLISVPRKQVPLKAMYIIMGRNTVSLRIAMKTRLRKRTQIDKDTTIPFYSNLQRLSHRPTS